MTPLSSLPPLRKPRERLRNEGVATLELEELLAIILGSGSSQYSVLSLAKQVSEVLARGPASISGLTAITGIGEAKAAKIMASLHLSQVVSERSRATRLNSPQEIYEACSDLLEKRQEYLVVFFLNVRNGLLAREIISIGTATASLVHPREVFRPAIVKAASHVILAHNHPSGIPNPSGADLEATQRVAIAGRQVGIELVDHVICAKEGFISLKHEQPALFTNL